MLSRSEILITKRFLFSKKTEGYVSIFSWFSIIGIALGVAAIIIGKRDLAEGLVEIKDRILDKTEKVQIDAIKKVALEKLKS